MLRGPACSPGSSHLGLDWARFYGSCAVPGGLHSSFFGVGSRADVDRIPTALLEDKDIDTP
jgi:hypothetical protein